MDDPTIWLMLIGIFVVSFIPLIGLFTVVVAFFMFPVFGFLALVAQLVGWIVLINRALK